MGVASAPPGLEVGLDVSTLRQLLLEQSDKIRESGHRCLAAAMPKLRQKQEEYLIEAKVQRLSDRCNSLASRLQMLEEGQQFTETKEDALDNPWRDTPVEQDLGRKKQRSRRRGKRAVNKEDNSGNAAPMTSDERDMSDDFALLGIEGSEIGSKNSLSEEAPECNGSWAKSGADGCTTPMETGHTDNSETADLGWKPKYRRSWNRLVGNVVGTGTMGMLAAG